MRYTEARLRRIAEELLSDINKNTVDFQPLITVQHLVDDVAAVMDALDIEQCVLAGESQGGAIAQYAAARRPERFTGLVLAAPRPARRDTNEGRSAFADACRADYPATVDVFVAACFPEPDCEHVKRWATNVLLRAEPDQAARLVEMWRDEAVRDLDPSAVSTPTLVVHGTADAIVPIDESRQLAAAREDVELLELDGVGHVPTMTRPEVVVEAIRRRFG